MTAQDSKQLQQALDEVKVTKMLNLAVEHIFETTNPNNAEMVVFSLAVTRMMMQRAIDTRTDYPAKMSMELPTGHMVSIEIKKPEAANPLLHASKLLQQSVAGNA